ncbi:DUF2585 family protein [Roseomonas sp. OT10]|uniref:DUF2585 family protein n=1 Tax=Roseomonas cutis TaxID=2897332 RepID=UPI001E57821C|nr:DUF2585 family protein [Roseomonas sp. OT10]UFN50311.1 DUF2585 family protein [Roseomonas sp. OT10]
MPPAVVPPASRPPRWPWAVAAILAILALVAAVQLAMGRVPWCSCGTIKLWHGQVQSAENSQHLSDWYTPSHIVHGLLFYAALRWLVPRWPLSWRAVAATAVEAAWEIVENTNAVIRHYREATISLDYFGDSVVNSLSDILAMLAGFALAAWLPAWASVLVGLGLELLALAVIRDNLTLNVLMLLYSSEAIRRWQSGGG